MRAPHKANGMGVNAEELAAAVREVRERVRARYSNNSALGAVPVADTMPLLHARDAAEGKVAAIGSVNPRPPGLLNSTVQRLKRLLSRALDWHVREQVEFNRATVDAIQASLEAFNDVNRALVAVAGLAGDRVNEARAELRSETAAVMDEIAARDARLRALESSVAELRQEAEHLRGDVANALQEFADIRTHWVEWRRGQETRVSNNEITFLKSLAESHSAFQHRLTTMETSLRETVKMQHSDFEGALATTTHDIQKRLWDDLERVRAQFEALIHRELRVVRQRVAAAGQASDVRAAAPAGAEIAHIDWLRFADRFRGSDDSVRERQKLYVARLSGRSNVLDLGCGRGELLQELHDAGITARGIDGNEEFVRFCHSRGLQAEHADIFAYLSAPGDDFDAIVATHVIEHLPPLRVPELIALAHLRLRPGGALIIETPNPESLASLARHFYADPTHTHPVPPQLLAFYLEEAGFGRLEVLRLNALADDAEMSGLTPAFRDAFFGALDYAIVSEKL